MEDVSSDLADEATAVAKIDYRSTGKVAGTNVNSDEAVTSCATTLVYFLLVIFAERRIQPIRAEFLNIRENEWVIIRYCCYV